MKRFILLLMAVTLLIACDHKMVFEAYRKIDGSGWNKDSIIIFNFNIEDTINGHNLYINIRNKGNYPNSNIWLFLSINSPEGTNLTDTVEFTLAEPSGKWRGSGLGDLFDNQFAYRSNVFFPYKGEYIFSIQQGMRNNVLKGIRDVGFRVERVK